MMLVRLKGRGTVAGALLLLVLVAGAVSLGWGSGRASGQPVARAGAKTWNIAVLVGLGSNAYQAAGVTAIKNAANANHASVTVFDSAGSAATQYSQFQTAITSGKYQGILINPDNGPGITSLVQQAAKAGIKVGAWNQPIGADLSTPKPTVPGVTTQVMFPVRNHGIVMGHLAEQACAKGKFKPCDVAILYYLKGSTYDTAVDAGFESVVAHDPSIKVVDGANTQATRQGGLQGAQTILTAHPSVDVMFGTSQAVEGAVPAVAGAHLSHKFYLLGEALSRQGAAMVANGQLFGGSQSMADQEGRLALVELTKALSGQPYLKGVDPDSYLHSPCANGVTKANVHKCTFAFNG
jgi:ribose transport system substrate-binding protein